MMIKNDDDKSMMMIPNYWAIIPKINHTGISTSRNRTGKKYNTL